MGKEVTVNIKSLGALTKLLSGFFSLTKKECQVLAALIHIMKTNNTLTVDKDTKQQLCELSNFSYQVTTNYISSFKRKKALNEDGSLHSFLTSNKIIINYGTNTM